ncbi:hypothetical protein HD554DRAFT_2011682, partial [Boletus coccyginus]
QLIPNLVFVDTYAQGDKKNRFGFAIKPDISIYSMPVDGHQSPANCTIANLDIHIEFKWHNSEDPFVVPEPSDSLKDTHFIHDLDNARDMLGQISTYAEAQLSVQYYTHTFSIYILWDTACII